MWLIVWAAFIVVILIPSILNPIIGTLHLARRMDFYIIMGFMFLIGLGFSTYIIARRNRKKIENIVRMNALKKEEEK